MRVLSTVMFSLVSFGAFAQNLPEEINAGKVLMNLVSNYKTMGALGLGMSMIMLIVWLLKSELFNHLFGALKPGIKRFIILLLGQAYALLFMLANGMKLSEAVVVGLFTSGGAVSLYEAAKPLFKSE